MSACDNAPPAIYRAKVTSTRDPARQRRARVKIPQLSGLSVQPWAEPMWPDTRVPEVGEEVRVFYAGGATTSLMYITANSAPETTSYEGIGPIVSKMTQPLSGNLAYGWSYFDADVWAPLTFTAPPSGMAFVTLSGIGWNSMSAAAYVAFSFEVSTSASAFEWPDDNDPQYCELVHGRNGNVSGGNYYAASRRTLIWGLKPGETVTLTPRVYGSPAATPGNFNVSQGSLLVEPVPVTDYMPSVTRLHKMSAYEIDLAWHELPEYEWPSLTFTVPPSGMVRTTLSGELRGMPGGTEICYRFYHDDGTAFSEDPWSVNANPNTPLVYGHLGLQSSDFTRQSRQYVHDGLTPGERITVRPVYRVNTGNTNVAMYNCEVIVEPIWGDAEDIAISRYLKNLAGVKTGWNEIDQQTMPSLSYTVPSTGIVIADLSGWVRPKMTSQDVALGLKVTAPGYESLPSSTVSQLGTKGLGYEMVASRRIVYDGLPAGETVTFTPCYYTNVVGTDPDVRGMNLVVERGYPTNQNRLDADTATVADDYAVVPMVAQAQSRDALQLGEGALVGRYDSGETEIKRQGRWQAIAPAPLYAVAIADGQEMGKGTTWSGIASGWAGVPWDSLLYGSDPRLWSMTTPDRFTAPVKGLYRVSTSVTFGYDGSAASDWQGGYVGIAANRFTSAGTARENVRLVTLQAKDYWAFGGIDYLDLDEGDFVRFMTRKPESYTFYARRLRCAFEFVGRT
ncbi:hypothetical protein [Streptomyces sp. NBC_00470]|uniref:hypothetical protein n=1 Tax=Streptomyces sp. NBC_00470 TaxID=2975753 RepID=UPI0030DF5A44